MKKMMMQNRSLRPGQTAFTLVEVVTSLAVATVTLGFLYVLFMTNWTAFGGGITRSDLWEEADQIVEFIGFSGRGTRQIDVTEGEGQRTAALVGRGGETLAVLGMNTTGEFFVLGPNGGRSVLSRSLDFTRSAFVKNGKALVVTIALEDQVLARPVRVQTSTEIYPRN